MLIFKVLRKIIGILFILMSFIAFINVIMEWYPNLFGNAETGQIVIGIAMLAILGLGMMMSEHKNISPHSSREKHLNIPIADRVATLSESLQHFPKVSIWDNPSASELWLPSTVEENSLQQISNMTQALDLFDEFINLPTINWKIVSRDCEARADYLVDYAAYRGFRLGKIWASAETYDVLKGIEGFENQLSVALDDLGTELFKWNYHVAPVSILQDGRVIVFDPGLFDNPVEEELWLRRVQGDEQTVCAKVTTFRMYDGPEDWTYDYSHESNLFKRTSILQSNFNINDPDTWYSLDQYLRAEYVKTLKDQDPELFGKLSSLLAKDFSTDRNLFKRFWYFSPRLEQVENLTKGFSFYNYNLDTILNELISKPVELRYQYLRQIFWQVITEPLTELEKALVNIPLEHRQDIDLDEWFSPWGFELWEQYDFKFSTIQSTII